MDHARAVIIGGGVGGTSVAYHLAELGWTDVVLVERAELTSGSTFHSAGLVGQLRSSVTLTKMMMYGVELYRRLAAETGVDPSWHEVGSLRLASTPERLEELARQAGWAKTFGLPLELIGPAEAGALFPLMSPDGVLGAVYLPTDGWLDPSGLAQALAAGARRRGVRIETGTRVIAIDVAAGRVTGVRVVKDGEERTIGAEVVVNAGGMFAPEIGRLVGVDDPDHPDGPRVPVHRADRRRDPVACRSCATRTTWSTSARRSAGCAWAATSATPPRGPSTGSRPTSTAASWRPTGRASRRSWTGRSGGSRRSATPASTG